MRKLIYTIIALILGVLFVAKFAGSRILTLYIQSGIGDCRKIPILCMTPEKETVYAAVNTEYLKELMPYRFSNMEIDLPKGFTVIKQMVKKIYYKRRMRRSITPTIYLLYEPPDFFISLFPQLRKEGINDTYAFVNRIMHAQLGSIDNLSDAFFVIMKGVFIPDIGKDSGSRMLKFTGPNNKGFINYTFTLRRGNFFDCNIIDQEGNYFKVYIKDSDSALDLGDVFTIISTAKKS